ncbi:MAG: dTDP-4-dehydrorhamnose 3,5-epimerase [Verrucomicrobiota bacterium]
MTDKQLPGKSTADSESKPRALKEEQSVTQTGSSVSTLAHGVSTHPIVTHHDERGSVGELYDPRWNWHADPLISSTFVTIHPGKVKGWALHDVMEDRFALLSGKAEFVFFDDRDGSPTKGSISKIIISENDRQVIRVPTGLWHAVHNIGPNDVVIINFPTQPYQYEDPDKYRLPLNTDLIPYKFEERKGF